VRLQTASEHRQRWCGRDVAQQVVPGAGSGDRISSVADSRQPCIYGGPKYGSHCAFVPCTYQIKMSPSTVWNGCMTGPTVWGPSADSSRPIFPVSCAAAHVAKKRRAAVSNCRAVIFNVICVVYSWWNQPLDSGLWSGEWRLDLGRATLYRRVSDETDFVVVSGDICGKNSGAQAWICAAQTLLYRARWKKLEGTLFLTRGPSAARKTLRPKLVRVRLTRSLRGIVLLQLCGHHNTKRRWSYDPMALYKSIDYYYY